MDSLKSFLEFRIEKIIPDPSIPVDLDAVCAQLGIVIEEREMIPEAVMRVADGRFNICLQSNFRDAPGARLRRRFSLAHEIGHTLFYDCENGEIKPRKDSPRGENLEAACHKAASMFLVPSRALTRELNKQPSLNAAVVVELADRFEVSVEVMLRRLNDLGRFESGWAPVLTRRSQEGLTVEYAAYPPWLKSHLIEPTRGVPFNKWFGGSEQADGKVIKPTQEGTLEASPLRVAGSSVIFEVRLLF